MANGKIVYTPTTFKSLALNGSEYCDLASSAFNTGTGDFAIDALIYPQASGAAGMYITTKVSVAPVGYGFYVDPTNMKLVFSANDGVNAMTAATANNSLVVNTWHWVRVEVDRSALITLFINGVSAGSANIATYSAGNWDNAANFVVGDDFTGRIGFLRFDKGRLMPAAWHSPEYIRLAYGYPRSAQDFQAVWTFNDALIDLSSSAYTLTHSGTATYTTGYPTGSLTYSFDRNFIVGHASNFIATDDAQRSIAGDLILYRGPRKRVFSLEFPLCRDDQVDIFKSVWASGYAFDFYEDADYPKTCVAAMMEPPEIVSQGAGYWQVAAEIVEI